MFNDEVGSQVRMVYWSVIGHLYYRRKVTDEFERFRTGYSWNQFKNKRKLNKVSRKISLTW
jgi:hypothetical protein